MITEKRKLGWICASLIYLGMVILAIHDYFERNRQYDRKEEDLF